jgi:hypothetical protein
VLRERLRALIRVGMRSLVCGVGSGFGRCCVFLNTGWSCASWLVCVCVCEGVIVGEQWYTGSTLFGGAA